MVPLSFMAGFCQTTSPDFNTGGAALLIRKAGKKEAANPFAY
jgi:hypothetical protein